MGTATTTIVVGLGNPILGDDGVGWLVADAVERRLAPLRGGRSIAVERLAVGGLTLMERLVGWKRAIIVDSFVDDAVPGWEAGAVRSAPLGALETRGVGHLDSAHDASLSAALGAGRALGAQLPEDIVVVTVDAVRRDDFDDHLTAPVQAAIERAADEVLRLLGD